MVLPMTTGACKSVKPPGTPKKATATLRITRLTRAATTMVSGPTHTSLRSANLCCEAGRRGVDAIVFSFLYLHKVSRRLPNCSAKSRSLARRTGCQHNDDSGKIRGHLHEQAGYCSRWGQSWPPCRKG